MGVLKTSYYLIRKRTVGKLENGCFYLFENGRWEFDSGHEIMDLLTGFDESEPPDSPYRIGCLDVMDKIEDITLDDALKLTGGCK